MLTYDDLARACREGDQRAEEVPLPQMLEEIGVEMVGAIACAEQRAIRIAFIIAGQPMPTKSDYVKVPMDKSDFVNYQSAVLDGIAIGLRAAKNAQETAS